MRPSPAAQAASASFQARGGLDHGPEARGARRIRQWHWLAGAREFPIIRARFPNGRAGRKQRLIRPTFHDATDQVPAQAGTHFSAFSGAARWIPAFAGIYFGRDLF